ncbi:MAG: PDZ domain-containing protein [Thermoguttaceae bacterium]|jgi:membrane-associated protease RseP (regulator of RpoE activity)|nr:PDZ domain-containing protein [Thermoguttaceae bacterium]
MRLFGILACCVALGLAAAVPAVLAADDAASAPRVVVVESGSGGKGQDASARVVVAGQAVQVSDHWIGVEAHEVPDAVRAHLKIPEGQGLLVEQVYPDSPAAKAKIQRHDILLKAGDKPLKQVADLIEAIGASQGKALSLEGIRAGKPMKVEVVPEKRPKNLAMVPDWLAPKPEYDAMMKWLEKVRPGQPGHPPMRFRLLQPGAILPPGAAALPPLPGGMTVAITKHGDQPAKIHVTRDGQTWDITENELDKLPADVRPHVERMLGRGPFGGMAPWIDVAPAPVAPAKPEPKTRPTPKGPAAPEAASVEKRLDDLNRHIEQLQKSVDELRSRLPAEAKTPKK